MRNTRTPAEWRSLFDQQFRSGLNKTQFCRLHGITRSAFSNAWLRLSARDASITPFVSALPPGTEENRPGPASAILPAGRVISAPPANLLLTLTVHNASLSLPADIPPRWLATLLREMAP